MTIHTNANLDVGATGLSPATVAFPVDEGHSLVVYCPDSSPYKTYAVLVSHPSGGGGGFGSPIDVSGTGDYWYLLGVCQLDSTRFAVVTVDGVSVVSVSGGSISATSTVLPNFALVGSFPQVQALGSSKFAMFVDTGMGFVVELSGDSVSSWRYTDVTRGTNLLNADTSNFEGGLGTWTLGGSGSSNFTLTRDTSNPWAGGVGNYSLVFTTTASFGAGANIATSPVAVTAGETYYFAACVRANFDVSGFGSSNLQFQLEFQDSGGTVLSTAGGDTYAPGLISGSGTAPAGTAKAVLRCTLDFALGIGSKIFLKAVSLRQADTDAGYWGTSGPVSSSSLLLVKSDLQSATVAEISGLDITLGPSVPLQPPPTSFVSMPPRLIEHNGALTGFFVGARLSGLDIAGYYAFVVSGTHIAWTWGTDDNINFLTVEGSGNLISAYLDNRALAAPAVTGGFFGDPYIMVMLCWALEGDNTLGRSINGGRTGAGNFQASLGSFATYPNSNRMVSLGTDRYTNLFALEYTIDMNRSEWVTVGEEPDTGSIRGALFWGGPGRPNSMFLKGNSLFLTELSLDGDFVDIITFPNNVYGYGIPLTAIGPDGVTFWGVQQPNPSIVGLSVYKYNSTTKVLTEMATGADAYYLGPIGTRPNGDVVLTDGHTVLVVSAGGGSRTITLPDPPHRSVPWGSTSTEGWRQQGITHDGAHLFLSDLYPLDSLPRDFGGGYSGRRFVSDVYWVDLDSGVTEFKFRLGHKNHDTEKILDTDWSLRGPSQPVAANARLALPDNSTVRVEPIGGILATTNHDASDQPSTASQPTNQTVVVR